jgi:SAM-dependent methyltransferase
LDALLRLVRPGETWIDIGAGAGRYALPVALALAPSGGRVIALDASPGMLDALMELRSEHGVTDVEVIETRWPPPEDTPLERFEADVALIAHVGYDIEVIGPFVRAMEAVASRLCVAILMERQPASVADACWPPVHGEERVPLPALPEFVELLRARGHEPSVEMLSREPRSFASRDELAGFLRRQLWIEPRGAADKRFQTALDELIIVDEEGGVGLRTQQPLPIGVVTWDPRGAVA